MDSVRRLSHLREIILWMRRAWKQFVAIRERHLEAASARKLTDRVSRSTLTSNVAPRSRAPAIVRLSWGPIRSSAAFNLDHLRSDLASGDPPRIALRLRVELRGRGATRLGVQC